MKIGVVSIQGDVSEHVTAAEKALAVLGKKGSVLPVRSPKEMMDIDALILPGGESTTIGRLLYKTGLAEQIVRSVENGMLLMGTCAGCVLLAKEGDEEVERSETRLLSLMNMAVKRNAFGRQRESFETDVKIAGFDRPFRGVFIRAPAILRTWGKCRPLAYVGKWCVMASEENLLAVAFHPELTDDYRIHNMFFDLI